MKQIQSIRKEVVGLALFVASAFLATQTWADVAPSMPDANSMIKGTKSSAPLWKDEEQKPLISPAQKSASDYKAPTAGVKKGNAPELTDGKATIQEAKGEVRVWKHSRNAWLPAEPGLILEGGDKVTTGAQSYAVVMFDKNKQDMARLDEKSEMVFRMVEPTEAFLVAGHVLVKLNEMAPGSSFKVGTNDAVTGVFGTTFEVIRRGDVTAVLGREGTVRVFGTGEENRATEFTQESWWGNGKIMQ
jgi:hypothetical protein